MEARERNLKLETELLAQSRRQTARLSIRELVFWKWQAKALARQSKHLRQIDQVMSAAIEVEGDFVEIPRRDYLHMLLDQKEFSRRAFELMDQ